MKISALFATVALAASAIGALIPKDVDKQDIAPKDCTPCKEILDLACKPLDLVCKFKMCRRAKEVCHQCPFTCPGVQNVDVDGTVKSTVEFAVKSPVESSVKSTVEGTSVPALEPKDSISLKVPEVSTPSEEEPYDQCGAGCMMSFIKTCYTSWREDNCQAEVCRTTPACVWQSSTGPRMCKFCKGLEIVPPSQSQTVGHNAPRRIESPRMTDDNNITSTILDVEAEMNKATDLSGASIPFTPGHCKMCTQFVDMCVKDKHWDYKHCRTFVCKAWASICCNHLPCK